MSDEQPAGAPITFPPCPCGAAVSGVEHWRGRRHADEEPMPDTVALTPCGHWLPPRLAGEWLAAFNVANDGSAPNG